MKTEPVKEEEKKKKKPQNKPNQWKKKKEKKKEPNGQPRKRKEKKKIKRCGWVLFVGPLCVFNYNIVIELWVMKTENNQNVFLVFITHNSKIRELNDGNRVMDFPNNLFAIGPTIFELWVMKTENWVTKTGHPVWLHFFNHSISITHHSSLINHNSSPITQFFTLVWHHHPISITQYFSYYLWAHTCQLMQFFFFSIPKLIEANKKKKKLE